MLWAILLPYRAKHSVPSSLISWLTCSPQTACKDIMFNEWHYKKPFQFSSSPLLCSAHKNHDNGTSDHRCRFMPFSTPCSLFLHKSWGKMLDKNIFHLKQWSRVLMTSCAEQLRIKSLGLFSPPKMGYTFFLPDPSKLAPTLSSLLGEMRVLGAQKAWSASEWLFLHPACLAVSAVTQLVCWYTPTLQEDLASFLPQKKWKQLVELGCWIYFSLLLVCKAELPNFHTTHGKNR